MTRSMWQLSSVILLLGLASGALGAVSMPTCKAFFPEDQQRLLAMFETSLSSTTDVATWHHSVLGHYLIRPGSFPKQEAACKVFGQALAQADLSSGGSADQVESVFHALEAVALLTGGPDCSKLAGGEWPKQQKLDNLAKQLLATVQSGVAGETTERLYHTVAALTALKAKFDSKVVHSLAEKLVKKDSSAPTQAYIFHLVSLLDLPKSKLKPHFDDIEDVIQQADEADGQYLYYDSGLFTTAFMVNSIYKLAGKYGEIPKIPEEKMLKLSHFLLSRRYVYQPRAAAYLLLALRTLSDNKNLVPVCVSVSSTGAPVTASSKSVPLLLSVTTVLGQPVDLHLKVASVKDAKTGEILNKSPIELKRESKTSLYELSLASVPLPRGHYVLEFTGPAHHKENLHYVGLTGSGLSFKVTAHQVDVGPIKLQLGDSESSSSSSGSSSPDASESHAGAFTLEKPGQQLSTQLMLDSHAKLRIQIPVVDASERTPKTGYRPHQCFLRLQHDASGREIILIATPSSQLNDQAKATDKPVLQVIVDPSTQAKDFGHLSGVYTLEVLIGDAMMANPVRWVLGKASITLPAAPALPPTSPSADVHWADAPRLPGKVAKPQIEHLFRPADKRAPAPVSTFFTALCVLPLALLLLLWGKLGLNVRGLGEASFSALGFHVCLTGIFVLYYFYWTSWNMFTTLAYIVLLGVPTFVFGNLMLKSIASQRQREKKADGQQ